MGLVFTIFTLVIESYPILIIKHSNTIKKKKSREGKIASQYIVV
jgi:hypothetical protein